VGKIDHRHLGGKEEAYSFIHTDVRRLELIRLIDRNKDDPVRVPWDIVETKLKLTA